MHLSLQRCLILWLCLLPLGVQAAPFYVSGDQWGESATWYGSVGEICSYLESRVRDGYSHDPCRNSQLDTRSVTIDGTRYDNLPYGKYEVPVIGTGNPTLYAYDFASVEDPPSCGEVWHHEGTDTTECGFCDAGYVDAGEGVMPRCQKQESKEECAENGEFYEQAGFCIAECASGSALGDICLDNPESECTSASDDYIGNIGFGGNQTAVCGDNECPNGGTYGFEEQTDGSYQAQCLPPDSNPPQCPAGAAVIIGSDGISFQCSQISLDDPDSPDNPDGSDGDSDGDGEGDITGITGQLDDIKSLLGEGNTNTNNINETLKGIGKSIKDGTGAITDAIGNIPGGGGSSGTGQTEIVGEDGNAISWSGEPIDTELTDPTEQYDQVMADYQAKINEIKGEVQAMFSTNLTGGGSVDDNTKTIMGVDVNFSLNRFLSGLDILGAIVLFCAAFISAGILFSGRG